MNIINRIAGAIVGSVTGTIGEFDYWSYIYETKARIGVRRLIGRGAMRLLDQASRLVFWFGVGLLVAGLISSVLMPASLPALFLISGAVPANTITVAGLAALAPAFLVTVSIGFVSAVKGFVSGMFYGFSKGITAFDKKFFSPSVYGRDVVSLSSLSNTFKNKGNTLADRVSKLSDDDKATFAAKCNADDQKTLVCPVTLGPMTHPVILRVNKLDESTGEFTVIDDAIVDYSTYEHCMQNGDRRGRGVFNTSAPIVGILERSDVQDEVEARLNTFVESSAVSPSADEVKREAASQPTNKQVSDLLPRQAGVAALSATYEQKQYGSFAEGAGRREKEVSRHRQEVRAVWARKFPPGGAIPKETTELLLPVAASPAPGRIGAVK